MHRNGVLVLAIILCLSSQLLAPPVFQTPIQLDFGSGGVVQSGWTEFLRSSDPLNLPAGVTAQFADLGIVEERDRGGAGSLAGLGLDDVVRDFLFSNGVGSGNGFEIKGLDDGVYDVTVYSFDKDYARTYRHVINGQTVTFGPVGSPASLDDARATVTVTLSDYPNNQILIYSPSSSYLFLLSGLVVDEATVVPEPTTLSLLALGAGALFLRRRRT